LANVILPEKLTVIEGEAFAMCKSILSITIPKSTTLIDYHAFWCCTGLKYFILPQSTEMHEQEFRTEPQIIRY
jgi:hypothetical protein